MVFSRPEPWPMAASRCRSDRYAGVAGDSSRALRRRSAGRECRTRRRNESTTGRNVVKSGGAQLRELFERQVPPVVPLALDPLSAKFAEAAGFEALYLGGGTLGYQKSITEANLTVTQMAQAAVEIRAVTSLPLILDGACGWGEPLHVQNSIRFTEAAGFAAIEIEDQLCPKRAHHHAGVEHLMPVEDMVQKIEAAVEARRDPDFVIIARTNACRNSTEGIDGALRRAEAY